MMIDLHCHLLPGIDDGPETMEQALRLAELAVENGITHSILTPHIHPGRYENSAQTIKTAYEDFRTALTEHNIPLRVGFAGEVRLSDEILPMVTKGEIPFYGTLKGYRILLLELPHSHVPVGCEVLVQWLLKNKIRPMIAHPERNKDIMRDITKVKPLIRMGCFFQVTAGSVAGLFGEPVLECAQQLLAMNCVTILASDAHNEEHRPPRLDHGRDAAAEIVGMEEATKMVLSRPRMLVRSQFSEFSSKFNKARVQQ